jgi:transcription elongation factor Elf1
MKSANIKPLKSCPMCDKDTIIATYEERARYRYYCTNCGQYFEFNAPSQFAADIIFNEVIRGRIDHPTEKGGEQE